MTCDREQFTEEYAGQRLDLALAARWPRFTRSRWQKLIAAGQVLINGSKSRSSYRIREGDRVEVNLPPLRELKIEPEEIPLDILFEDSDLIVVNKPQGMVVHPAPGHHRGTLVNALLFHCGDLSGINGVIRPGIVHRIDKDTSGVVVAAKNDFTHRGLARQLQNHTMKREYTAVVFGHVSPAAGTIRGDIGRHHRHRKKMAVVTAGSGRPAVTHYRVSSYHAAAGSKYSQLVLWLETGRTHQIRVHMAYIGHPVVGDPVYGPRRQPFPLPGQALHARLLGFVHPRTGEYMEFTTPPPPAYQRLLENMEREGAANDS